MLAVLHSQTEASPVVSYTTYQYDEAEATEDFWTASPPVNVLSIMACLEAI